MWQSGEYCVATADGGLAELPRAELRQSAAAIGQRLPKAMAWAIPRLDDFSCRQIKKPAAGGAAAICRLASGGRVL